MYWQQLKLVNGEELAILLKVKTLLVEVVPSRILVYYQTSDKGTVTFKEDEWNTQENFSSTKG